MGTRMARTLALSMAYLMTMGIFFAAYGLLSMT